MDVVVYRHPAFLAHAPGPFHPERPDRLRAIDEDLSAHPPDGVRVALPGPASREQILRIHRESYFERIAATAGREETWLDPDTQTSAGSFEAAVLAAGAACEAAEAVVRGGARGAFALVRPPGHHAESDAAMGFCLFNNVAVAAADAVARLGCRRVAILDPDVHHGNGTQRSFWLRRDVLYVSTHRYPFYPGTGWIDEVGAGPGEGYTVNVPVPEGTGDADLVHLYRHVVGPVLEAYRPDLILISVGFDTFHRDPLGGMALTRDGYLALFGLFREWAVRLTGRGPAYVLEGGYDLEGMVVGTRAVLETLAGTASAPDPGPPTRAAEDTVERLRTALAPWWRI